VCYNKTIIYKIMIRRMKLMTKSENIEVLKEGKPTGEHECEFIRGDLESDPSDGVYNYKQICRVCGRTEHVSRTVEFVTFETVFEKFYGKDEK
jgi:hypothetical protein